MNLENEVICAFGKIIKKYNLQTRCVSGNEIILFSPKYILSFLFHSADQELVYIERRENGELFAYYNIDSFIAHSISKGDRLCLEEKDIESSRVENELTLLAYILEKKCDELLSGGKEWIKEYQKFLLSIPPRNVTRLLKERYNGLI